MEDIRDSLKNILVQTKKKSDFLEKFKSFFSPQERKHIDRVRIYKDRVVFYLDSPLLRYKLNLKRGEILREMRKEGFNFSGIIFKV